MKRPRLNPRKLLIASAGVATVNYALAAGCSDGKRGQFSVIANLMPGPPECCVDVGTGGSFPGTVPGTVANLVAPPPPVSPSPVSFEPRDAAVQDAAPGDADADAG
jgi:hypothetical protein